jgi:hypothetical protein
MFNLSIRIQKDENTAKKFRNHMRMDMADNDYPCDEGCRMNIFC